MLSGLTGALRQTRQDWGSGRDLADLGSARQWRHDLHSSTANGWTAIGGVIHLKQGFRCLFFLKSYTVGPTRPELKPFNVKVPILSTFHIFIGPPGLRQSN